MKDCTHKNAFENKLGCLTCPDCDKVIMQCQGCKRLGETLEEIRGLCSPPGGGHDRLILELIACTKPQEPAGETQEEKEGKG